VSGSTGHADPLAVSYQGVGTLTGGNGGCDGVIEQAALLQKRRLSSLGDIRDQSVQQGAQPPDDLVLPGAEGPDLVEGEFETREPTILFETGLPPRYYIPPEDVREDVLFKSQKTTQCPY
jgi:hypothetical protein